jgi:cytochrome c553
VSVHHLHATRTTKESMLLRFVCLSMMLVPFPVVGAATAESEYAAVLRAKPDSDAGQKAYETCAACHGPNGFGTGDGYIPVIAAQHYRFVARALIAYRHGQRWDPRMEHFVDRQHLQSIQDIADVAFYVSLLAPIGTTSTGDGRYSDHGAATYDRLCSACHGRSANGNGSKRYPRLAGQHYAYLLRQMHDAVEGRRPNVPVEHVQLLEDFDMADLRGVADYLSRLSPRREE